MLCSETMTPRLVETYRLFDLRRNLNSDRIPIGRRVGDRQQNHKTWPRLAVACRDETGRAVVSLIASRRRLMGPKIIIADDEAWLGLGKGHSAFSLQ